MTRTTLSVLATLALAPAAIAQNTIDPNHKFSWQENTGWMNWRDPGTPPGAQGVRIGTTILQGLAWAENLGFVNFGDGSPAGANGQYTNSGDDHGVNILPGGQLSGFAWGENVGWINFAGGALATPPQPARLDLTAHRLRGFAWGENIGWINLDDATAFVAFGTCPCDVNASGAVNSQDLFDFLTAFFAGAAGADFNHDGRVNSQDFFDFLACFFSACA